MDKQQADQANREALLESMSDRLRQLTRKMLRDFPRVHRWEETDDVFQNALLRLWRTISDLQISEKKDILRLGAVQIRRELVDLARHYFGPEGIGTNHASNLDCSDGSRSTNPLYEQPDKTQDREQLSKWTTFHEIVESMPEDEREVFELVWYQGLAQAQVAELLSVTERTIQRRWQQARLFLHQAMKDNPP